MVMRVLLNGALALLLFALSVTAPEAAAEWTPCADAAHVSENASIRADVTAWAGDFIKPEAAQRSLAQRTEEQSRSESGGDADDRHVPGRINAPPSNLNEPAPPSASVRRAHLLVYRL